MITTINEFRKMNEGRGNTRIRFEGVNYPTYYIDYYTAEDDEEFPENVNDDFLDDVTGNIKHFKTVQLTKLDKPEHIGNDQVIYLENDIIKVVFADNENTIAVGCIPVFHFNGEEFDSEEIYDEAKFKEESKKFFTELLTLYKLSTATSAWTSREVTSIDENKKLLNRRTNEGFGSRIAIGDLEHNVKNAIVKQLYKMFPLELRKPDVAFNDVDMELGTVYFNINTLEVETDGSTETIAKFCEVAPDELATLIKGILKTLPPSDLGINEKNTKEINTDTWILLSIKRHDGIIFNVGDEVMDANKSAATIKKIVYSAQTGAGAELNGGGYLNLWNATKVK